VLPESRDALRGVHRLAADLGLTAYDATYLDLAIAMRLPLATLDDDLRRAARSRKVPVVLG
jgi:predicted nucleic acid-binding protein